MREDGGVLHSVAAFIEGYWWLVFILPPVLGGSIQQHHRRRLAILAAKGKLAESKGQALSAPPEPQPICGCSHHLSFHSPHTAACAVDDCRCQQYVGPEPLGYVFAQPLINPVTQLDPDAQTGNGAAVPPSPA
jgi:hypothetical protein